jgi:hypothetical protein
MQWTRERTTWLGTYRERRGRWHGIPYMVSAPSTTGITPKGWAILVAAALLFTAVVLIQELLT